MSGNWCQVSGVGDRVRVGYRVRAEISDFKRSDHRSQISNQKAKHQKTQDR